MIAFRLGILIAFKGLAAYELLLMGIIFLAGEIIGCVPVFRIHLLSLADEMTVRL